VCLDDFDPYYSPQDKRKNIEHPDFELVEGSILDRELPGRVFVDVDYVFHDAAHAGVHSIKCLSVMCYAPGHNS